MSKKSLWYRQAREMFIEYALQKKGLVEFSGDKYTG